MPQRLCAVCGQPFEAVREHGKYCGKTCGKRAQRAGMSSSRSARHHATEPVEPPAPTGDAAGLVDSVRQVLNAAGKLNTVDGQLAVALAEKLTGFETAGAASISRELSRVLGSALQSAARTDDPLDELQRRRDAKRAQAAT